METAVEVDLLEYERRITQYINGYPKLVYNPKSATKHEATHMISVRRLFLLENEEVDEAACEVLSMSFLAWRNIKTRLDAVGIQVFLEGYKGKFR